VPHEQVPVAPGLSSGLEAAGLRRVHERLAALTETGEVPALAALLARGEDVHTEVLGHLAFGDPAPLRRDAIFRIASLSKPIAAAGAMLLVDDGVLSLSDPRSTAGCRSWRSGASCARWRALWTTPSPPHGPSRSRIC
jgi:CubicO group peptidase (beta-lactamase class C family)